MSLRLGLRDDWAVVDLVASLAAAETQVVVHPTLTLFGFELSVGTKDVCNGVSLITRRRRSPKAAASSDPCSWPACC